MCENLKLAILLFIDLVTPSQGQGHQKRYELVEVNGTCKHGLYERIWQKSLQIPSNVKAMPHNGPPASHMNMTDYIDRHATPMDQKLPCTRKVALLNLQSQNNLLLVEKTYQSHNQDFLRSHVGMPNSQFNHPTLETKYQSKQTLLTLTCRDAANSQLKTPNFRNGVSIQTNSTYTHM